MSQPVIIAVIAASAAVIGSLLTAFLSSRSLRIESAKLALSREHNDAEIAKLRAETQKLTNELSSVTKAANAIQDTIIQYEKEKIEIVLKTRNATYPELLELVYRIRNQVRDTNDAAQRLVRWLRPGGSTVEGVRNFVNACKGEGRDSYIKGLWQLTEDLYRYKAVTDPVLWDKLHKFKRLAQDLVSRLDKSLRGAELDSDTSRHAVFLAADQIAELADSLSTMFEKMDLLYGEIDAGVRMHFRAALKRAGIEDDNSATALFPMREGFIASPVHRTLMSSDATPPNEPFWPAIE